MGSKNDTLRKLVLRRETMKTLSGAQLDKVNGAYAAYTQAGWQCDTTICDPTELNMGGGGWGGGWGDWGGGWGGDWGGGWAW